jgi:hypothetical protein
VKEVSGHICLYAPTKVYDCGDSEDIDIFDRITFLMLSDFFNKKIANDYNFSFGLQVLKEYGFKPYPDEFKFCGITIKRIMREAKRRREQWGPIKLTPIK